MQQVASHTTRDNDIEYTPMAIMQEHHTTLEMHTQQCTGLMGQSLRSHVLVCTGHIATYNVKSAHTCTAIGFNFANMF